MKRLLIVNLVLLAIVVVLVVRIVALWWGGEVEERPPASREAKAQRLDLPPASRRPVPPDLAGTIAAKDLFDASRAPEKATTTTVAAAMAPPLNLALLGVTVVGGGREALVKDQAQPKPLWLREGEDLGGYKVSRIDVRSVVMITPAGDEVTLEINVEKGKAPTGPATGPAGIQPTPVATPPGRRGRAAAAAASPAPVRTPRAPAADIKEKIERLREEARARRGQPKPQPEP